MDIKEISLIKKDRFFEILSKMKELRIGLIGDGCLDIYWEADMKKSELSRETPHFPLPIVEERFSLGGAANVANNISTLGIKKISLLTTYGKDWRGQILLKLLKESNIDTEYAIALNNFVTPAYCKPIRSGISNVKYEDPRLDFQNYEPISDVNAERIVEQLNLLCQEIDVLVVSDQFSFGCITPLVRDTISQLGKTITVFIDSRNNGYSYQNVILKPNEVETKNLTNVELFEGDLKENLENAYEILSQKTGESVVFTLGEKGSAWVTKNKVNYCPTRFISGEIDFVGAGDTFLSALSCAYSSGATELEAIFIANLASSITIQKIGTTGTATQKELITAYEEAIKWKS